MSNSYQLGRKGEAEATRFLTQNNYSILEKNYRYRKAEVDLIVQKKQHAYCRRNQNLRHRIDQVVHPAANCTIQSHG